jgi:hypothetical protein
MSVVLRCEENTRMSQSLYFVPKEHEFKTKYPICGVSRYKRSNNHVYVGTMKNKNKKTAIGPESVDDETNSEKEDKKKRDSCLGDVVPSSD